MVWAKLDDAILDNPKIARAGVYGFALHVAAITWCCRNLTDGFIPYARTNALLDTSRVEFDQANPLALPGGPRSMAGGSGLDPHDVAAHLVACGLWERVDGGYSIHDFLVYNPSREEVIREKEKGRVRSEKHRNRQRTSGDSDGARPPNVQRTSDVNTGPPGPDPDPEREETQPTVVGARERAPAPGSDSEDANPEWGIDSAENQPTLVCSSDVAPGQTIGPQDEPRDVPVPSVAPGPDSVPARAPRRKPETDCPTSAEDPAAWLAAWGIPSPTEDPEVSRFLDHHRSKANRFRDWLAAWRKWRAGVFAPTSGSRLRVVQQAPADGSPSYWEKKSNG